MGSRSGVDPVPKDLEISDRQNGTSPLADGKVTRAPKLPPPKPGEAGGIVRATGSVARLEEFGELRVGIHLTSTEAFLGTVKEMWLPTFPGEVRLACCDVFWTPHFRRPAEF